MKFNSRAILASLPQSDIRQCFKAVRYIRSHFIIHYEMTSNAGLPSGTPPKAA